MTYNPIFEEETDRKTRKSELKRLKRAIKKRARKSQLKKTISRVYNLLKRMPISSWLVSDKDLVKSTK